MTERMTHEDDDATVQPTQAQGDSTDAGRRTLHLWWRAARAGAELRLGTGRAWVVVVGTLDARRALALAELVGELVRQPSLHRVSVDLTCTVATDRWAAVFVRALRAGSPPWADVTTPGATARVFRRRHAA
jgi:hypothetical protein